MMKLKRLGLIWFAMCCGCASALAGSIAFDVSLYDLADKETIARLREIEAATRKAVDELPEVPGDGRTDNGLIGLQRERNRQMAQLVAPLEPVVRDQFVAVPGRMETRTRDSLNYSLSTKGDNLLFRRHDGFLSITGTYQFEYLGFKVGGGPIFWTSGPNAFTTAGNAGHEMVIIVQAEMKY